MRTSAQIDQEQLDDLLFSRRKYPWTREEFIRYLKTVYSEESFEFMIEYQRLKTISSKEHLVKESTFVFELYVKQGSEKQINVSSSVRSAAEKAFKQDPCQIESIYREIYDEARNLILTGFHIQKFNSFVLNNLDEPLAYNRVIHCIVFFLLALTVSLCLIFLLPQDRWIRFASLPLWYLFSLFTTFRFKKMCPIATFFNVRCTIKGEFIKLEDSAVMLQTSRISKWMHIIACLAMSGFVAVVVSVPLL